MQPQVVQPEIRVMKIIDFEVLYTRTDWRDPAIQKRLQQAEKYEIPVPEKIPVEMIRNLPNGSASI